jgi:hypothetical protein
MTNEQAQCIFVSSRPCSISKNESERNFYSLLNNQCTSIPFSQKLLGVNTGQDDNDSKN